MRNLQDHYSKKARAQHYYARSVYKLIEIDDKFHVLKRGIRVLDLGCAPGSWAQYILKKTVNGHVVGVDIKRSVQLHDSRFTFVSADIHTITPTDLGTGHYDLITSDAMPNTTGNKFSDSQFSLNLVESVFHLAEKVLVPGGSVVAKVFQGEDLGRFVNQVKKSFRKTVLFKPKSSRKESREIFIIALNRTSGGECHE